MTCRRMKIAKKSKGIFLKDVRNPELPKQKATYECGN